MFAKKGNILRFCFQNEQFFKNLLQLLSEKILILDNRLCLLSRETIRQKICFYLIERYREEQNLTIHTAVSREKMAEQFAITRPSLSRELSKMKREGLIDLHRDAITIKNLTSLEENL